MLLGHMSEHSVRGLRKRNLLVGVKSYKLDFGKYWVMVKLPHTRKFKIAIHKKMIYWITSSLIAKEL